MAEILHARVKHPLLFIRVKTFPKSFTRQPQYIRYRQMDGQADGRTTTHANSSTVTKVRLAKIERSDVC